MPHRTKIYINGRFLCRQPTGVDRVAYEVCLAIDQLLAKGHAVASQFDWELLLPPDHQRVPDLLKISTRVVGRRGGNAWEQISLPLHSRGGFLLNLCNTGPLLKRRAALMLHDAATRRVPQAYTTAFRLWYRLMAVWAMKILPLIFTPSHFSSKELQEIYGRREIIVTSLGIDHFSKITSDESIYSRQGLLKGEYVLAVGSLAPHKNFKFLVDAIKGMNDVPFQLVIAGGTNPKVFGDDGAELPSWVKYVGFVSDAELKALYQGARAFVFPSLYEGFGLPPLEAMANGCPVICSDAASIPEACGNAAIYFDPSNATQFVERLSATISNPSVLADLRARGCLHVRQFTWERVAETICFNLMQVAT